MFAVSNDFNCQIVTIKSRFGQTEQFFKIGFATDRGGATAEDMGDSVKTCINTFCNVGVSCIVVSALHFDAQRYKQFHQLFNTFHRRTKGDYADMAMVLFKKPSVLVGVFGQYVFCRLCALMFKADERAFKVSREHTCIVLFQGVEPVKLTVKHVKRSCHKGGGESGDAVFKIILADSVKGFLCCHTYVKAHSPVAVDFTKSRQEDIARIVLDDFFNKTVTVNFHRITFQNLFHKGSIYPHSAVVKRQNSPHRKKTG